MKKILVCYGTRPELIKISPILKNELVQYHSIFTLCTGQHSDLLGSDLKPDHSLEINNCAPNRLNSIFSYLTGSYRFDQILEDGFTHVMVQGDTASALACALAAFNKGLGVIHLEAGLRTHDKKHPYPEEAYRQAISRLTDVHLCATDANKTNLDNENVKGEIHVVGNTVLDNLTGTEISYNNDILITLHRRENHELIPFWYQQIEDVALNNPDLNFVFISHPNPNSQCALQKQLSNVSIIPPVAHKEFVKRIGACRFLITDSGGLQEEASFLKKKAIVCRETTERPEALGTFTYLCKTVAELPELFNKIKEDFIPEGDCPFGDGKSAEKILQLL